MVAKGNVIGRAAILVFSAVLVGAIFAAEGGADHGSDDNEGLIPSTVHVDAVHGSDDNEGLTPGTALATIQEGVDKAVDGDIVLVYPGLYREEVNFLGKTIVVQGVTAGPAGVPVLHNPDDFAVSFYSGEGPGSVLKNFIIKNNFMAVFIAGSSPTISNLTIVDNMYGIEASPGSEPDISNIIFWNNNYSDLFGCRTSYSRVNYVSSGQGNINGDPLFVDPENDDYRLRSNRGRYWPEYDVWILDRLNSPCIDGGDPNAGPLDEPMPNGNRINMGAYGGTPQASMSPYQQTSLPGQASNPNPADGAVEVDTNVILSWTPGANTVSHDVYFGYFGWEQFPPMERLWSNQTTTEFDPGRLDVNTTYYWRIDEVNSNGKRTGVLWKFTTTSGPPPKGRACFTSETNVWVNSALVPISTVALGQRVLGIKNPCKIQEVQKHNGTFACYDILLESGNCISVAENHYFLAESGQWISLKNLKKATRLQTPKGSIAIVSITKRPMPYTGKVYNLKVEGSDRYMVGKDAVIVRDY